MSETAALVLFSGGQDSTVCLAWALDRYARVETVAFFYGQRHAVELGQRERVRAELARMFPKRGERLACDHALDLAEFGHISDTALTREAEITIAKNRLPTTFVPGRNLVFFTYAAALAYRRGIRVLVGGMCETDYSGYPDCRNETLQTLARAISLGMDETFAIETPLMFIDKAGTWALAERLGGAALVALILEEGWEAWQAQRS
jgi:7-cyano-7-deazaguanine synthase